MSDERQPAADWDRAYEAVYKLIRTLPTDTDRQAVRNAVIWRAVSLALDAANPIQPKRTYMEPYDHYDVAPIEVPLPDGEPQLICPRCSHPLEIDPSHDESVDGLMLQATPDQYRCERCDYQYAD